MKLSIKIHAGSVAHDHAIEVPPQAELSTASAGTLPFTLDGEPGEIDWVEESPGVYSVLTGGQSYEIQVTRSADEQGSRRPRFALAVAGWHYLAEVRDPRSQWSGSGVAGEEGPQVILAPMPGRVVKILVAMGQDVNPDDGLLVIEAMKMQNELRAPRAGRVTEIYVREGTGVESGAKLVRLV